MIKYFYGMLSFYCTTLILVVYMSFHYNSGVATVTVNKNIFIQLLWTFSGANVKYIIFLANLGILKFCNLEHRQRF